jgi:hypothetical protein
MRLQRARGADEVRRDRALQSAQEKIEVLMVEVVMRLAFARLMVGLALACIAFAVGAGEPVTLEERMSKDEFHAAELDKLSPQGLKALNDWLAAHPTTTTVTKLVSPAGKPVFYADSDKRETIESRISGKFTGWRGNTVFKLDNGEEWKQVESGQLKPGTIEHPAVTIEPMTLGSWLMSVHGCECKLRVMRTK